MACLLDASGSVIFLCQYHVFGRLQNSVNTEVKGQEISRHHAALSWRDGQWMIKDLSTNGTWLNGKRIAKNQFFPVAKGATLQFGHDKNPIYILFNDRAPVDSLCRCRSENTTVLDENTSDLIVELDSYHLLPNMDAAKTVVYKNNGRWWVEDLINQDNKHPLKNEERIQIGREYWQFYLAGDCLDTMALEEHGTDLAKVSADFKVSQDEESIQLGVHVDKQFVDLKIRNYHYLSLYLARRRALDKALGMPESEQGWVYVEQVSKDLRMEETAVNLHVHRARKQFAQQLQNVADAPNFIERRPSQLRFGIPSLRVLKADIVECELTYS